MKKKEYVNEAVLRGYAYRSQAERYAEGRSEEFTEEDLVELQRYTDRFICDRADGRVNLIVGRLYRACVAKED